MRIWVDADACPRPIREILFRAAERAAVQTVFVANGLFQIPRSVHIVMLKVPFGPDMADKEIIRRLLPGDLVITADIPLAAAVLDQGGHALDPRGEPYSPEDIGSRLSVRSFMEDLRSAGIETGGPTAFHLNDRKVFANRLDTWLTVRARQG